MYILFCVSSHTAKPPEMKIKLYLYHLVDPVVNSAGCQITQGRGEVRNIGPLSGDVTVGRVDFLGTEMGRRYRKRADFQF